MRTTVLDIKWKKKFQKCWNNDVRYGKYSDSILGNKQTDGGMNMVIKHLKCLKECVTIEKVGSS